MTTYVPHLALPVSRRDHTIGHENAPITLVEYGDFECPHCGATHSVVKTILRRMGLDLRFVFRHFPISTSHPHAQAAAESAEAAGAQGRFWEMHDMLFEHQDALENDDLLIHAKAVGLDLPRFVEELTAGTHTARVREDFMSGVRSGVNGTPTFFINGARYDGVPDVASLVAALEDARRIR